MTKCPNCGHANREGVLLCDNCGANLAGKGARLSTKTLTTEGELVVRESVGTATFGARQQLRLEIEGGLGTVMVEPQPEAVIGRRDPESDYRPTVDLTAFAAYRMGVSRRHAALWHQDEQLNLRDLGSSNGTFLNGQRLVPDRHYTLRDGDEIRLGHLVMRVYFD